MFAIVVALGFVSCEKASSSKIRGMWIARVGWAYMQGDEDNNFNTFRVLDFVNKRDFSENCVTRQIINIFVT